MKNSNFVSFEKVDLQSGFWQDRYNLNKTVSMQNVRLRFEESGRFDALRFNFLKTGKEPHIFYDSDVAKWMEAVAYLIAKDPDSMREHEALCEELIDCMEKAQRPDGYLNSQHQQISPKLIFRDRNRHELYCAGHLIEAAIAYHKATGRDRFLKIMERYCDCIERVFLVEDSASFITPGHEEIELALIKLYRHTQKEKYLKMASYFLEKRGNNAKDSFIYEGNPYGGQDDVSIRNLKDANGHCVRAVYFYSGIADLAAETDDRQLFDNLEKVFEDITERKMYITGGIGSTRESESFTVPYDLPNHTAYTESCCAIALMMFTSRMREISKQAKYGHLAERVLYNSMLSSTSLDGKAFFYENPLEIALEEKDREVAAPVAKRERLPITQRVEVFGCSCCPPNINRFFAHLGDYVCVEDADGLCVEQYISSDLQTAYGAISIREQYALDGKATVCGKGYAAKKISVRIPEWSRNINATLNGNPVTPEICDGYAYFSVDADFTLDLDFGIALRLLASNPNVRANVGRVALTYGPLVYCLEKADNGAHLNQIAVDPEDLAKAELKADFHKLYSVCMPAYRLQEKTSLYYDDGDNVYTPITAKWIPYFAFANRGESDMLVWVRKLVK